MLFKQLQQLFYLMCMLMIIPVSASELTENKINVANINLITAPKNETVLMIKPLTCIVRNIGDVCEMMVNVFWENNQLINTCLFQNTEKLTCWKNKKRVKERIKVRLFNDMTFILRDENSDALAQQVIKINSAKPKKLRRRLKADWSIF